MSKIMAVDVGFAASGIAVMDRLGDKWIPADLLCLRTTANHKKLGLRVADDDVARLMWQTGKFKEVIRKHEIKRMVVELPPCGARDQRAARCMALASGMIAAIAEVFEIAVEWYTPHETRKAAVGEYTKDKNRIMGAMIRMYPVLEQDMPTKADREHVADALATFEAAKAGNLVRSA